MDEHTNYLGVGIFVLVGSAALLAISFWISGAGQTVPISRYTIIFERDVNGLSAGSPVRFLGVDVGNVSSIQLSGESGTAVEVNIDVDSATPITSGTYASLAYQGITGVAFIHLATEPGASMKIAAADGRPYPAIPAKDVGLAALMTSGPEVMGQLNKFLEDGRMIIDEENRSSVTRILGNLEQLTGALAEQRAAMSAIPAQLNDSLVRLQETLDVAARFSAQAEPELLAASQNLRQTTDNLVSATGRMDEWLIKNDAAIDSFLADGVGETAALVTVTRTAMREMQKLGTELRRNPSMIVYKPRLEPVVVEQ